MKKIFFIFLFAFFTFSFLPESSLAYLATEQTAVKLNEDTLLFTITYRFSFMNYALRMPIGAVRNAEYGEAFPDVGYALFKDDGTVFTEGKANAIVLSNTRIVGTEYVTEVSKAGYFTLFALVTLPKDSKVRAETLHLRTTTQPFTLVGKGKEIKSQLDQKQLETYKTPSIAI